MSRPGDPSDRAVVRAVLDGDRDAFAVLVARYHPGLLRMLRGLCRDPDDAEDLAQAAFLRAYLALATYRPEYAFSTWLYQIALNLSRTEARKRARARTMSLDDDDDDAPRIRLTDPAIGPERQMERSERSEVVWRAVRALPDEFRSVFVLRNVQQMAYREICELTGLPLGTVKSRLARARERLAAWLLDELDAD